MRIRDTWKFVPAIIVAVLLLGIIFLVILQIMQGYGLLLEDIIRIDVDLELAQEGVFQISSALATIIIAGLTALTAWQVKERDKKVLERKERSARAPAMFGLSETTEIAERYALLLGDIWLECQQENDNELVSAEVLARAQFPGTFRIESVMGKLREAVEFSSEARGKMLLDILADLQVLHSNMRALGIDVDREDMIVNMLNIESYILRTLDIYSKASNQFDWARNGVDNTRETTPAGANRLIFLNQKYVELHNRIEQRLAP